GERDTEVMLDGVAHWRPLVNGDSGFMPRPYTREMELLAPPLTEDALRLLRAIDVHDVVTREEPAPPAGFAAEGERVHAVPAGERARAVLRGDPTATRWTEQAIVLDFAEPRRVAAISFEISDEPWISSPRVEASDDGAAWRPVAAQASLADAVVSLIADPRHGRGEVTFAPVTTRHLRVDARLPARGGALQVR